MTGDSSKIVLQNDRLEVEIAQPGTVYRGTRFDWTGFVTQVRLDGMHTFCQPESLVPGQGTGGIGICNEFAYEKTLGYEDARPGELFPKPGIGLLKKPDEAPYFFARPYEIAELFPVSIAASRDQVVFTVEPVECRGFALRLVKTLRLQGNQLTIDYLLENTGQLPVNTHEYCHNFMGIDGLPIGPDYRLSFPYPLELEDMTPVLSGMAPPLLRKFLPKPFQRLVVRGIIQQHNGVLDIQGSTMRFRSIPRTWFYCRMAQLSATPGRQWELIHQPTGAGLREIDSFPPTRVQAWGTTHVVSAEVFVDIHLPIGQTQTWTRKYEFFA